MKDNIKKPIKQKPPQTEQPAVQALIRDEGREVERPLYAFDDDDVLCG